MSSKTDTTPLVRPGTARRRTRAIARTRATALRLATAAALVGVVTACGETTSTAPAPDPGSGAADSSTASEPSTTGAPAAAADGDGQGSATELHVAPDGDDGADGSAGAPLKSLGAALAKAGDGASITLAAGSYPAVQTSRRFAKPVRITGPTSGTPATIAGLNAVGANGLSFRRVSFGDTVTLTNSAADLQRETGNVAFRRVRFTTPDARTSCLAPRNGSHDVAVVDSTFRRCFDGIASAGAVSRSGHPIRRILVRHNDIRAVRSDGINFAYWEDARIERNTITDLRDPDGKIHNDAIQIMGGSRRIQIRDNVLTDSRVQLLFVEPTIGGPVEDLDVENNLMVGAGAAAVQLNDTPRVRFVGNTVANSRFQGLMLRHQLKQPLLESGDGAVIANNVLAAGYLHEPKAPVRLQTHNVMSGQITGRRGPGDVLKRPRFTGKGASMRLARGSAGTTTADPRQWKHRPRTGPAAKVAGYVPPKAWR